MELSGTAVVNSPSPRASPRAPIGCHFYAPPSHNLSRRPAELAAQRHCDSPLRVATRASSTSQQELIHLGRRRAHTPGVELAFPLDLYRPRSMGRPAFSRLHFHRQPGVIATTTPPSPRISRAAWRSHGRRLLGLSWSGQMRVGKPAFARPYLDHTPASQLERPPCHSNHHVALAADMSILPVL